MQIAQCALQKKAGVHRTFIAVVWPLNGLLKSGFGLSHIGSAAPNGSVKYAAVRIA